MVLRNRCLGTLRRCSGMQLPRAAPAPCCTVAPGSLRLLPPPRPVPPPARPLQWRAFSNQHIPASPARQFVDGDLIEQFLDLK